jgi:hypothetical protein
MSFTTGNEKAPGAQTYLKASHERWTRHGSIMTQMRSTFKGDITIIDVYMAVVQLMVIGLAFQHTQ